MEPKRETTKCSNSKKQEQLSCDDAVTTSALPFPLCMRSHALSVCSERQLLGEGNTGDNSECSCSKEKGESGLSFACTRTSNCILHLFFNGNLAIKSYKSALLRQARVCLLILFILQQRRRQRQQRAKIYNPRKMIERIAAALR